MEEVTFNNLGFNNGDNVRITFFDGTERIVILYQGTALPQIDARVAYIPNLQGVLAQPAKILIISNSINGIEGIDLTNVLSVELY
jgi:hypothetical protein